MTVVTDTSFWLAITDRADMRHMDCVTVAHDLSDRITIPVNVLPEVCYLIDRRMGHLAMRRFIQQVLASGLTLEQVTLSDLARSLQILNQYADTRLDFVDSTIVAVAERLGITTILTLDQRHFRMLRPRHCPAFELLP